MTTRCRDEIFGLVHPAVDAHTLGISAVAALLEECGYQVVVAEGAACEGFGHPSDPAGVDALEHWLRTHRIAVLGFSYRLDPRQGADLFAQVLQRLRERRLFTAHGGPLAAVYFAGLPAACALVRSRHPEVAGTFCGDETPAEVMASLGLEAGSLPPSLVEAIRYDTDRLAFGRELIRRGDFLAVQPVQRGQYNHFGTAHDTLTERLATGAQQRLPPLMRAHAGPYLPDRQEAVRLFLDWTRRLASSGHLDILSIGTSQLTQSRFGEEWGDAPNGGGVPLNSAAEFAAVWRAARPMLVRSYAGTRDILGLARMYERTIHIAWHALSLWWFCRIDGRGPNTVRENLRAHLAVLRYIASTGKPYEPNVAHHFAFRGADDVSSVVAAYLGARAAKEQGIRHLVLQVMLNTPKSLWGVQDLAKARATLALVRGLEDESFRVILQPRGGLDYFSPDGDKAKAQLAAVTALMDDIEPHDDQSPPLIHVVSYSEGTDLATPEVIDESICITRAALSEYRRLRQRGQVDDMARHPEAERRTAELLAEARAMLRAISAAIPDAYSADGLYRILREGYLPLPYLWACRDEFVAATAWRTRVVRGAVRVVDESGAPLVAAERLRRMPIASSPA